VEAGGLDLSCVLKMDSGEAKPPRRARVLRRVTVELEMEEPSCSAPTWTLHQATKGYMVEVNAGGGAEGGVGGPKVRSDPVYLSSAGRISAAKFSRPDGLGSDEGSGE
jgi:hypothetical protein